LTAGRVEDALRTLQATAGGLGADGGTHHVAGAQLERVQGEVVGVAPGRRPVAGQGVQPTALGVEGSFVRAPLDGLIELLYGPFAVAAAIEEQGQVDVPLVRDQQTFYSCGEVCHAFAAPEVLRRARGHPGRESMPPDTT
jgi:hypothetical protein